MAGKQRSNLYSDECMCIYSQRWCAVAFAVWI